MAVIALICAILLANQVRPAQINITALSGTDVNTLPEGSVEAVFALQILQIRTTSEATPAASAGNNQNVVGSSHSPDVAQAENFQAIFTIYSLENKNTSNKKYHDEGNAKLLSPFEKKVTKNKEENSQRELNNESVKPLPLVWDSCLETTFKDDQRNVRVHNDMENARSDVQIENNIQTGNVWSKRNANDSVAMKFWPEKNSKSEARRQQKADLILIKKTTERSTTSNPSTSTTVKRPTTKEIFEEPTHSFNKTSDLVTENNIKAGYTEDWFEAKDRTKIRFSGLPQTKNYLIPTLKLEEGFHPFGFMSDFFSMIYPFEFPVAHQNNVNYMFQSIKVESTFLGCIIAFTCIALVVPAYLIILGILSLMSRSRCDDELETGALFADQEESDCNDRVVVIVTLFVVLMCCSFIFGMAVSNEQAHAAAMESRHVISCACADVASWLTSAARELRHSLVPPVDLVLHAFREDLKNADSLLGGPIKQAIASESGIDLVLDSLTDIIEESDDLSSKISTLRDVSIRAGALASTTSDRIKDLARQLENLKQQCTLKDAPLCDTINTNSLKLEVKFDLILHEQQLLELHSLGNENLTRAISTARQEFRTLPSAISSQTAQVRADILKDIEIRKENVHASARILSDIARHLSSGLQGVARQLDTGLERVQEYEFWRWTTMMGCVATFGSVTLFILFAMLCGCGRAKDHAKRTLQVSVIWISFTSLVLWGLVSSIFLLSGHAEVYICHALWDSPQYKTLAALLDKPSPLLSHDDGIFDAFFRDLENITLDVSVRDVLRGCEQDGPAYVVFRLDKLLDVNKETSYFEWYELQTDLSRLASSIDVRFLKTVSDYFNEVLNKILDISSVDLAKYRINYNGPIVKKDLPSLVDQLGYIAAQVTDLNTAGRFETLATTTQRLHTSNIKPLEQLKADVVFKLTELELQLAPFRRKLNISLSHIHTAQFYIDNQSDVIAQKKASSYVSRLISHAAAWRNYVLTSTGKEAAHCRPLFNVYSALRTLLCTRYVASLHGWWVCGFLLGVSWCTALAPLCVKLWRIYGRKFRAFEAMYLGTMGSGLQETPTTAMCESSNWNTPGPPPRSDSW